MIRRRANGTFVKGSTGWAQDHASVMRRFWAKVRKTSTCWLWIGQKNGQGYGEFSAFGIKRKTVLVHRFIWTVRKGPIPKGMCVCHKCDTPLCIRLSHLFLGTKGDNAQDALRKGRRPQNKQWGNRNAQAA